MKVYVIQKGQYSDRTIVGVTETEEEAKEVVHAIDDDAWITEYDTKQFKTHLIRFVVEERTWYDGNWYAEYDQYDLYKEYKESCCAYDNTYVVYAESKDTAIKIAQDIRAQYLAEKEGIV